MLSIYIGKQPLGHVAVPVAEVHQQGEPLHSPPAKQQKAPEEAMRLPKANFSIKPAAAAGSIITPSFAKQAPAISKREQDVNKAQELSEKEARKMAR